MRKTSGARFSPNVWPASVTQYRATSGIVASDVKQIAQRLSPRFSIQIYYELLAQTPVCIVLLIFKMKLPAKCNERTARLVN